MSIDELRAAVVAAKHAERAARELVSAALLEDIAQTLPEWSATRPGQRSSGGLTAYASWGGEVMITLYLPDISASGSDTAAAVAAARAGLQAIRSEVDAALAALPTEVGHE